MAERSDFKKAKKLIETNIPFPPFLCVCVCVCVCARAHACMHVHPYLQNHVKFSCRYHDISANTA